MKVIKPVLVVGSVIRKWRLILVWCLCVQLPTITFTVEPTDEVNSPGVGPTENLLGAKTQVKIVLLVIPQDH